MCTSLWHNRAVFRCWFNLIESARCLRLNQGRANFGKPVVRSTLACSCFSGIPIRFLRCSGWSGRRDSIDSFFICYFGNTRRRHEWGIICIVYVSSAQYHISIHSFFAERTRRSTGAVNGKSWRFHAAMHGLSRGLCTYLHGHARTPTVYQIVCDLSIR